MTIKKLKSQLEQVESALALARVLIGLISAGYNLKTYQYHISFKSGILDIPGQWQPSSTKASNIDKETESSTLGGSGLVWNQASKGNEHGYHLAKGTVEEELATTDSFNQKPRTSGKNRINNHVDPTENRWKLSVQLDRVFKENGQIIDNRVAAPKLLHELR